MVGCFLLAPLPIEFRRIVTFPLSSISGHIAPAIWLGLLVALCWSCLFCWGDNANNFKVVRDVVFYVLATVCRRETVASQNG